MDDSYGHFEGGPGSIIAQRYRILEDVGLGTFGRVVKALDLKKVSSSTTTTTTTTTRRDSMSPTRSSRSQTVNHPPWKRREKSRSRSREKKTSRRQRGSRFEDEYSSYPSLQGGGGGHWSVSRPSEEWNRRDSGDGSSKTYNQAWNVKDSYVAIKIVRNVKRYYDSALIEADIIQDMNGTKASYSLGVLFAFSVYYYYYYSVLHLLYCA